MWRSALAPLNGRLDSCSSGWAKNREAQLQINPSDTVAGSGILDI